MSRADMRLNNIIEAAAQAVTDEEGRFEVKAVRDELRMRLANADPHVQAALNERQIKTLVTGFRRSRQPKVKDGRIEFNPFAAIPVADGVSVWMGKATPDDVRAWMRFDLDNVSKVLKKSAMKQDYGNARLDAWRANPTASLLELEKREFQWEAAEGDLDWGDGEDED